MVQTTGHHLMNQTYLWYWCKEEYAKRSLLVKGLWIELWLINKTVDVLRNFLLFFIFNISHIFFLSCFWIYFFTFSFLWSSNILKRSKVFCCLSKQQKEMRRWDIPTLYFIITMFYTQYKCMYLSDFSKTQCCWNLLKIKEPVLHLWCVQSTIWQHSAVLHTVILHPSIISVISVINH